ncbi:hypothetical protein [Anaeromicrobium sediminis]|nr:hypothetical protein [Anaeromicrobium sediminis]
MTCSIFIAIVLLQILWNIICYVQRKKIKIYTEEVELIHKEIYNFFFIKKPSIFGNFLTRRYTMIFKTNGNEFIEVVTNYKEYELIEEGQKGILVYRGNEMITFKRE